MDWKEADRRQIFEALERAHGTDVARKMMVSWPMVPWEDLATKADLERFATKADLERFATKADLEIMEHRLTATFRGELVAAVASQTRMLLVGQFGMAVTLGGLVLAILQLA